MPLTKWAPVHKTCLDRCVPQGASRWKTCGCGRLIRLLLWNVSLWRTSKGDPQRHEALWEYAPTKQNKKHSSPLAEQSMPERSLCSQNSFCAVGICGRESAARCGWKWLSLAPKAKRDVTIGILYGWGTSALSPLHAVDCHTQPQWLKVGAQIDLCSIDLP